MRNLLSHISHKSSAAYTLLPGPLPFKLLRVVVGIMGVDDNFRRGTCGSRCLDSDGVDSSHVHIPSCPFAVDGDGMPDSLGNGLAGGGILGRRVLDLGGIIAAAGGEEVPGEDASVCNGQRCRKDMDGREPHVVFVDVRTSRVCAGIWCERCGVRIEAT